MMREDMILGGSTGGSRARRDTSNAYLPPDVASIVAKVVSDTSDASFQQSMHFKPGVLAKIRRMMMTGATLVTDTNLVTAGIDKQLVSRMGMQLVCYIDDPHVVACAGQKRITRAEVAVDQALTLVGPKIIVVGSAPMALVRLMQRHRQEPLVDTVVIAAPNGFASVVEAKERVWESNLPSIVIRGRKGGASATVSIVNALLKDMAVKW